MVRLLGVQLPDNKGVEYALTLLYGIGWSRSYKILSQVKISKNKKVKDLSEDEVRKIIDVIEKNYMIEGDLKEEIIGDIKRQKEIGSYIGFRHIRNLPVRGQRTRSNARTKRGKRKTVGALRKEIWAKMEQGKTGSATATKSTEPKK
ncbi:30S ribosomal protein S13 [Candidatus Roizmanbacteria bacterium RIFCSPHIGHO2_02_FULL_37_15]|uniref:Small ribosomal subunit protein uS13 n=1 Tax=Candidatus Roizmanbacteria bacterium RIFCSPLOWO2_01_FULL_37_16 TaxID=1802058 RepID=A0A1F7IQW2_9BACT|nr:MAG: 30S ribosomal protein S13 [Candidatus Roizmanbacteria bacterium RIFCSPHIGHO2_01_FULL_37_16b]OGK20757.1 MAG: 30S ribosomal protein S13 [Candidatus Roizmanbacteria bacterium RIFCSPHIGHO2_02_FULL_37_15]OGK33043.1 MAG: 30S ribosomal protein S13 [Candidatus Roizmanbacteria bacterium RIFCSPHIGHO2_12_FULL_36_11]OGK45750.1 MAG: 30S ribosomal protein S13 [Candidatus Roizmanbacteria bacterium RIFCSPLOWO2_01_FULL_37_16]OGK56082.1 MAG: 30S ribosomal protein S13 [Candidatus Roizmanbacteria bacterium